MVIVTSDPIDPNDTYNRINASTAGSVVFHYAVVRGKTGDRVTAGIQFERGGDMESEMKAIVDGLKAKLKVEDILIIRRLGRLKVGDIISLIAASAPNRKDAFEACMEGIVMIKGMKTIRKEEY
jgi:molybdopterin synthase catalytic subunit